MTDLYKQYKEFSLSHGMKLHVLELREIPIAQIMFLYPVGSANERPREQGMAHFLEHMMFKGTSNFPQGFIDHFSLRSGGENNACTDKDMTIYYHLLPSDSWKEAVDIEFDRMVHLKLDPKEFALEKNVVLEEVNMYADEPGEVLYDGHYERSLEASHPYQHPVLGTVDTLKAMGPSDMAEFYDRFYGPGGCQAILLGDIDAQEAADYLQECLHHHFNESGRSGEHAGENEKGRGLNLEPSDGLGTRSHSNFVEELDVAHLRLSLSFDGHCFGDLYEPCASLLEEILSGGKTSLLTQHFKEELHLVSQVHCMDDARELGGRFFIEFELRDGVRPERIINELQRVLPELREKITPELLEASKNKLETSFYQDQERMEELGFNLAQWLFHRDARSFFESPQKIRETSLDEVLQFFDRTFSSAMFCAGLTCPIGESKNFSLPVLTGASFLNGNLSPQENSDSSVALG